MKKSYAESVCPQVWHQQPHDKSVSVGGGSSNQSQKTMNAVMQVPLVSPQQPQPTIAPATPQGQKEDGSVLRAGFVEELNTVQAALASLPESPHLADVRGQLASKEKDLKKKISLTRPLASRLDTCLAAVERSKKRMAQASEAEANARQLWEDACRTKEEAAHDLAVKESELASIREKAIETGTVFQPSQRSSNSLEELETNMTSILQEMQTGARAPQEKIAEALTLMSALFVHLTDVSLQCKETEEIESLASTEPAAMNTSGAAEQTAGLLARQLLCKRVADVPVQDLEHAHQRSGASHEDALMMEAASGLGLQ